MVRHRLVAAVLVAVGVAVGGAVPASASAAPVQGIEFKFPGTDNAGNWRTPAEEVRIRERGVVLRMDGEENGGNFDYVRVELAAPGGVPLEVGTYTAVSQEATATTAGLLVISRGLACWDVTGSTFTVSRLERDAGGVITGVDVDVEEHCGSAQASFVGRVYIGE